MATKLNFTQKGIQDLPPAQPGKREYYMDTQIKGLQLVVTDKGHKSFHIYKKINGKTTRRKIGEFPYTKIAEARREALDLLSKLMKGIDPRSLELERRHRTITLSDTLSEYLKVKSNLKPKTKYDYQRVVSVGLKEWQNTPLSSISKDMVTQKHIELGDKRGKSYSNLCMRVLRALFNFASEYYDDSNGKSIFHDNPVQRLSKTRSWHQIKRRTSYIKPHQLPAWYHAVIALKTNPTLLNGDTIADFLLLLLFTGLRRNEAQTLTWDTIDLKHETLTILDTKNHDDHTLPLSDFLVDLLEKRSLCKRNNFVFPGSGKAGHIIEPRKAISHVIKNSGVKFTLHDLRRTFTTVAEGLDISSYSVKRLVNHRMTNDVTASYIITSVDRLRDPMQKITDHLLIDCFQKEKEFNND